MSTGIRILPGNTAGYLVEDSPWDYQTVRAMIEWTAKTYPESLAQMIAEARWINQQHLRRLLKARIYELHGEHVWRAQDRWATESLPRAERRIMQKLLSAPAPKWNCDLKP